MRPDIGDPGKVKTCQQIFSFKRLKFSKILNLNFPPNKNTRLPISNLLKYSRFSERLIWVEIFFFFDFKVIEGFKILKLIEIIKKKC